MSMLKEVKIRMVNTNYVSKTLIRLFTSITASFALLLSGSSFSEDIELYLGDNASQSGAKAQVLIIFDTSGSMRNTKVWVKPSFDTGQSYGSAGDGHIYYTKGSTPVSEIPVAGDANENRRFNVSINGCKTAETSIATYGFYTGRVREYTFQGNSGQWSELPDTNGSAISLVDCQDDVASDNNNNAKYIKNGLLTTLPTPGTGFPVDGKGSASTPQFYTANAIDSNSKWNGELVTLYSAKYLRWYKATNIPTVQRTLMDIAKESVTNVINSAPEVSFGLQVFNYNYGSANNGGNGGRVAFGIQEATLASKLELTTMIKDEVRGSGNTPLCETLYEASRYFSGKSIVYGKQSDNSRLPLRDTDIEKDSNTKYITPFAACKSDEINVIIITDGKPTADRTADSNILSMHESGQPQVGAPFNLNGTNNYLAALAGWMHNNDLHTGLDGKQTAKTSTVGFGQAAQQDAEPLLKEAALLGGGEYYPAGDSASLSAALNSFLSNIEPRNDSLTSASVAANTFDRTQTLEYTYYAMFQPDRGPRWQGNLKKYKVIDGVQKGKHDQYAVDAGGSFSKDVTSYWSATKDGNTVAAGGVADMLRNMTSRRKILTNISGGLTNINDGSALPSSYFGNQADLAALLDVPNDSDTINEHLDWAMGLNIDQVKNIDGSIPDMRQDVFGDPLHSKPVVINYGSGGIYIVVGTNQGALHMFNDVDAESKLGNVVEQWAFMPQELFPNIKPLRENFTSSDKVYGVDGEITAHITDIDGNGIVDGSDEVWIFFGLRRGGSSYYALNITNPVDPKLMWTIEGGKAGHFQDLGQTWSQPKVAYSKLNASATKAKPVLVFGGGYDTNKDDLGVGDDDSSGNAIYMVDAETGTYIWSMANTNASTIFPGKDSIPSSIATLDSDADGLTDRLYTGDTGGNVWRIDMPGTDTSEFSVFKLASFGHDSSILDDRRFFSEPTIVRAFITETLDTGQVDVHGNAIIVQEEVPYDAVLIGSGDRTNPLGVDTDDVYYMIKDINVRTQQFTASSNPVTPTEFTINDLFDYTDQPFEGLTGTDLHNKSLEVSLQHGWYFNLVQSGEKSTATGLVINNVVYFTTYTPPTLGAVVGSCEIPGGKGWLYAVNLSLGLNEYEWLTNENDLGLNRDNHIRYISDQFLDSPTLVITKGPNPNDHLKGTIFTGPVGSDADLEIKTLRTYLVVDEQL